MKFNILFKIFQILICIPLYDAISESNNIFKYKNSFNLLIYTSGKWKVHTLIYVFCLFITHFLKFKRKLSNLIIQ